MTTSSPTQRLLVGPPELLIRNQTPAQSITAPTIPPPSNAFMDLMVAHFNNPGGESSWPPNPRMGFTENGSATFLSTGNPCLDFFFHVVPDTPAESVATRLSAAWAHDPLTALKLVCNLRGVRGTGKSDKEGFYTAALWLHRHHPKTLAQNVASLASFGYFKDLPEILHRLLEGDDVRALQRAEWARRKPQWPKAVRRFSKRRPGKVFYISMRPKRTRPKKKTADRYIRRETRVLRNQSKGEREKERARQLRKEKVRRAAEKLLRRYKDDQDFRFLHDKITDHFAECLVADVKEMEANPEKPTLSLAAKWCPSLDSSFDRSTLLCESIAKRVFPRENYADYIAVEEAHYSYRVRDRLRKEILVPLRQALQLPEVYMGANRWSSIPYARVASVAMKNYKKVFMKHDEKGFTEYLSNVRQGKAKIAAGALLPHEIIAEIRPHGCCYSGSEEEEDDKHKVAEVAELQWKRMVEDLSKQGKMRNCLAVCDVSGSMSGTPMDVSVALGLLVSEISDEPWKGKVVTFSEKPQLHVVKGDDLRAKIESVERMEWGMNTDFQKVFDLILRVAVKGKLKEEDMIKRILVFSDMEFDEASASNRWETDYEAIVRKFNEKGYGRSVPQIVFWNLRDSMSTPVMEEVKGVALVSGFSKNLLKLFMEDDGNTEFGPVSTMHCALSGPEYQKLVVVD